MVALYLLVIVAAAALLPCPDSKTHGVRLVLCLLAIEALALAAAVPFLTSRAVSRAGRGARPLAILAPVLAIELISMAIFAAAARGRVPIAALAWVHLFYLAFAWLLAALTAALVGCGLRATTAQATAGLLGVAMLGQLFVANALVEAATAERLKMRIIDAVLWTNPWLLVGGSILQADPLRSQNLYEWSVIIYYPFRYPGSTIATVWGRALFLTSLYGLCAGLLQAGVWLLGRRTRRAGGVQRVDNS